MAPGPCCGATEHLTRFRHRPARALQSVPVAARIHIAFFTPGYPYVDAALRAAELARRHGAAFSRVLGEYGPHRDQFVRGFLESGDSHVLLLDGDIVPPDDVVERLLRLRAPAATAVYPQWVDDRLVTNVQGTMDAAWLAAVPPRAFPVRRCRLGCVLVQREVFAKVPAPWFLSAVAEDRFVAEDEWFCGAVREAGLAIRCDGAALCAAYRQGSDLLALAGGSLHAA